MNGPLLPNGPMGGTKWQQQQQNGSLGHFKSPVGRNLLALPKKKVHSCDCRPN